MRNQGTPVSPGADVVRSGDDPAALEQAATLLRAGELVAFPTETVYGLGADATSGEAVARIYETKARPSSNPLIVHVAGVAEARRIVRFSPAAERLAERFWPGPLTLVLPRGPDSPISLLASAGLDTVAVRVPAHPTARSLLRAVRLPLAAPSANPSGKISPTTAQDVVEDFGDQLPLILDGGSCEHGLESTVVALTEEQTGLDGPCVLRPGAITIDELDAALCGLDLPQARFMAHQGGRGSAAAMPSPGMLRSHYAPTHPVRLHATEVHPGEGVLAFGPNPLSGGVVTRNLSASGNLREAAANLYAMLRSLDREQISRIAVMPVPGSGLAEAIRDRLQRAAAPRDEGNE